jgi:PAS domain S-box-containing protein
MAASRAGRQVMRRYALTLGGLLAAFALLLIVAIVIQYQRLEEKTEVALKERVASRSAVLTGRTAVAIQQVTRSRDAMESAMKRSDMRFEDVSGQLERVANAERAQKPIGTYWSVKTSDSKRVVEVIGDEALPSRLDDPEVRATFGAARDFAPDHSSDPTLFRSVYVSARHDLMVIATPAPSSIIRTFQSMWQREKSLTTSSILSAVDNKADHEALKQGKFRNRGVQWRAPYLADGLDALQVTLTAYVYQGDVFRGTINKQYLATSLLATHLDSLPGDEHLFIVTPERSLVDIAPNGRNDVALLLMVPSALKIAIAEAKRHPGLVIKTAENLAIITPIEGTPWHLLLVAPKKSVTARLFTDMLPTTLAILAMMVGSTLAQIGYRRSFLKPAIALLERAQSPDSTSPPPVVGRMWQPWIDVLDKGKRDAAHYVRSLEEQADLRNAILGSAIDGIVTSDESGVITDFNPAAAVMFGWTRDEIIGQKMEDTIVPPAFKDRHRNGMAQYVSRSDVKVIGRKVELQGLHKNGRVFPIELAIAEATVGGARTFIGYIRNLTEQQKAQAELLATRESLHQSEKLTALGSLLAGVAHELNNPLAIVVGRAAILEEKLAGSPHLAPIQKLRAAADRCGRIVKTFLAMARQSGPRRGIVQLNDLIEGAFDMASYGLRTTGVEVRQELARDLPTTSADEDQLVQVIINLIVNAQHAMAGKPGKHHLTIRTRHDKSANAVIIEVEDSGPGMPKDVAARAFDPFFTTKDVGSGTGMGLSVSRGMIEAHGGTLSLASNSPKGATFRVTLPILIDSNPDAPAAATDATTAALGHMLIVDDEAELAAMLVECLAPLGVTCDIASDGQDALNRIGATHYDAVIADVRMPGMNGVEFYTRLQAEHPALAATLAFVSGDVLHNDAARVAAIGDRPVIEKPFNPEQVREVALRLLAAGDQT